MKVGDKVRLKKDLNLKYRKMTKGEVIRDDWQDETITVRLDPNIPVVFNYSEIAEYLELIVMDKVTCPLALKEWWKACEKYIGVNNG